jgi:hypothetical protein
MSGQNLYAALLGLRATAPAGPTPTTIAPQEGPGGGVRTRNPTKDGRAPHRQPSTSPRRAT